MNRIFSILIFIVFLTSLVMSQESAADYSPSPGNDVELHSDASEAGFRHVLMSLILPGSGEWAVGRRGAAKAFIGVDVALWVGLYASKQYVNRLQTDLEGYAAVHAGVNTGGKDEQFWVDIGTSNSIFEYNALKLLERNLPATYTEGEDSDWLWDSEENRDEYIRMRFNRLDWKRSSTFVVAGLVLNRLVSGIDVIRLVRKGKTSDGSANRESFLHMDYARSLYQGETVRFHLTWLL